MNKGEFVEALADAMGSSRSEAGRALNAALELIAERLEKGEKVVFAGFGSFEVTERVARTGRNPQTGEPIQIPATNAPKFSPGATLKKRIAGK